MNRLFFSAAFLLGASAVVWMASTFVGTNNLALAVTLVIACVYVIGFMELVQFRAATFTLSRGLNELSQEMSDRAHLNQWLLKLHPSLRNAVALRIEGERVGLPAPVITPYLVGLLVMLGLLGTFVGMVETLSGAVIALEATTELQAIRAGLAEPINGLSVAFGTSVAGVAASAMLGLISTLTRRDRMLATRILDGKISTAFCNFSLAHNRQQTYSALQMQAQALPDVAAKLSAVAQQLGQASEQLSQTLIASQQQFHDSAKRNYQELAASVGASLNTSLAQSGQLAGESIRPIVEQAMAEMNRVAESSHQNVTNTAQRQLDMLAATFSSTSEQVSAAWQTGLDAHSVSNEQLVEKVASSLDGVSGRFEATAMSLLSSLEVSFADRMVQQDKVEAARLELWGASLADSQQSAAVELSAVAQQFTGELTKSSELQQASLQSAAATFESMSGAVTTQWEGAGEQIAQLNINLATSLDTLRESEEHRGIAAIERLGQLEAVVTTHLVALGREMEAPMARLIETASETPKAAAEVIGKLRDEVSNNIERDNQLLEERQRIMQQLENLSLSLEQTSQGQREALETLVSSSAGLLQKVGSQFDQQVTSRVEEMSGVADNFSGSAAEMASLGEAFTAAVSLFSESNSQLTDSLSRIEQSLDNASARSDEQMNYYVAQARQIIDQSMASQKEMFDELRRLGTTVDLSVSEVS